MTWEKVVGRIGRNPVSTIADRAARVIAERPRGCAVSLAPDGVVMVESPSSAIDDEIVGVYRMDSGLMALWRRIGEDLAFAASQARAA